MTSPHLVEITPESHGVTLDIVYATTRNFTGAHVYARAACYLVPEASDLLHRAVALAARQGYGLHVYDGFRPSEAQWKLWHHTPDPEFISDPRRGSPHSMGAAIDLTLVDATSGEILDMGTGFDDLRPLSHHGNLEIAPEAQAHRMTLLGIMTAAGWDFFRNEWWHYQVFNARARYPVLTDRAAGTHLMTPSRAA